MVLLYYVIDKTYKNYFYKLFMKHDRERNILYSLFDINRSTPFHTYNPF